MKKILSFGIGIGTKNKSNDWLEVYFHEPKYNLSINESDILNKIINSTLFSSTFENEIIEPNETQLNALFEDFKKNNLSNNFINILKNSKSLKNIVIVVLYEDTKPCTVPEAYLKLHLISHRMAKPHELCLDGIFGTLPNVAWTNIGPVDLNELPERQLEARVSGKILNVKCVDKFPNMTDYIVPDGVRIAHTARVRLGAYIGKGTTIMHEGFVNFNAGTEGVSMIEGRISAGVVVGEGSDLGGGSSTMGTLSGGGNVTIKVGEKCLIGANAGIGIGLGDNCIVEAGLYITAGTKLALIDDDNKVLKWVKASELNGKSNLLFRRNSTNGQVECKSNSTTVELNEILHSSN